MSSDGEKRDIGNDELKLSTQEHYEINKSVFQTAAIISFGAFVLLVSFLGEVWGSKEVSAATLDAIFGVGLALFPVGFLVLLVAWQAGLHRRSPNWIDNLVKTLPVWAFLMLLYVAWMFGQWYFTVKAIVGAM